jgi:putative transposase
MAVKTLATIWEIDDELWSLIEPRLREAYPPKSTGRPQTDLRKCLNGIIYRMRSGCQWNFLPKRFGDDSTIHRWFQIWTNDGMFERLWALLIEHCEELCGVEWKWQAADAMLGKARFGGSTSAATRRIAGKTERRKVCSSTAKADRWPR